MTLITALSRCVTLMVTLSRVPSWEYGITVAGAGFRGRWLGSLNLSASCLNLSVPDCYPLQGGNNNHTLSERAVCEDGMLILGKCLELCLATSKHCVSGSYYCGQRRRLDRSLTSKELFVLFNTAHLRFILSPHILFIKLGLKNSDVSSVGQRRYDSPISYLGAGAPHTITR